MIEPTELNAIKRLLFNVKGTIVFAIVDGSAEPDLLACLTRHHPEFYCLFRGELEPDMARVAPYLVALEPEAPFTDWVLSLWGLSRAIFGVSYRDLHSLKSRLRRHVMIEYEDREVYFRYYDPTVLRNYLPTCTELEIKAFFGDIEHFIVEGEEPGNAWIFRPEGEVLGQRLLALRESCHQFTADGPAAKREPRAGAGRLTVRPEQLKQLGMSIYLERMRLYLNEVFPESRKIPRSSLDRMVTELTERAAGYKLVLENHVAAFLAAAWILGMDFDDAYPVAKEVLLDYEMDCGRKAEWLWDFIDATAVEAGDRGAEP